LDKPFAQNIALVHRHWSGKHRRVVAGINLVTLVWADDTHAVPCDYRLFDAPNDTLTKNDHFRAMCQSSPYTTQRVAAILHNRRQYYTT
jgi:putative transposase